MCLPLPPSCCHLSLMVQRVLAAGAGGGGDVTRLSLAMCLLLVWPSRLRGRPSQGWSVLLPALTD